MSVAFSEESTRKQKDIPGNHLGNVQVTLGDYIQGDDDNNPEAEVYSSQDYYGFGMVMPGRSYTLTGNSSLNRYRFGFNGQERETELNPSITSAEYWMYDGRLGRRWNVDPLIDSFPYFSSYLTFANSPIIYTDHKGDAVTPETVWDVLNVGMGVLSFVGNVSTGNIFGAVVDGVGLVYDGVAAVTPFLPAGASTGLAVYRFTTLLRKTTASVVTAKRALAGKGGVFADLSGRLQKLENSLGKHGKLDDVLGAIKEKLGIPLESPKPNGSPTGHIQEVEGVINSIKKTTKMIDHALSNKEINILKETKKRINEMGEKYQNLLDAADKAAN